MAQEHARKNQSAHSLEIPQEVREKMARADHTQRLIDKQAVSDLHFVDVTHHTYRSIKRVADIVLSTIA